MKKDWLIDMLRCSVPFVQVETADNDRLIKAAVGSLAGGKAADYVLLQYRVTEGLTGLNVPGSVLAQKLEIGPREGMADCAIILRKSAENALTGENFELQRAVIFVHNFHQVTDGATFQSICNLRERFKAQKITMVFCGPAFVMPPELKRDVICLSEELPNSEDLKALVVNLCESAGYTPKPEEIDKSKDALSGLAYFEAEQVFSLEVRKAGLDIPAMWERKFRAVENTKGVSIYRGKDSLADLGGNENIVKFLLDICKGRKAPKGFILLDEVEKAMAGIAGDSTGTSQDFLMSFLTTMQDYDIPGIIKVGVSGGGKTAVAKAVANEVGIPLIQFDLGAMKGKFVGDSETAIRDAWKIARAITNGDLLVLATCNSFGSLPPEFKRRFTLGTFFFDLCSSDEREKIWAIYQKKFGLEKDVRPLLDEGWTGAEIKQCCAIAWRLDKPLSEAAKFIVPVAKSASEAIENLRKQANEKFISASHSGVYRYSPAAIGNRKFDL